MSCQVTNVGTESDAGPGLQGAATRHSGGYGKITVAEGASHYLYVDVPDLVAESILAVIYEARAK